MEFQSQAADHERVITLLDKVDEAILSGPWPQYLAQCSVRGACGFVLAGYWEAIRQASSTCGRRESGEGRWGPKGFSKTGSEETWCSLRGVPTGRQAFVGTADPGFHPGLLSSCPFGTLGIQIGVVAGDRCLNAPLRDFRSYYRQLGSYGEIRDFRNNRRSFASLRMTVLWVGRWCRTRLFFASQPTEPRADYDATDA